MHYVYVSGILIGGILPYLSLSTVILNLKCVTTLDFIIIYYSSLALFCPVSFTSLPMAWHGSPP